MCATEDSQVLVIAYYDQSVADVETFPVEGRDSKAIGLGKI